MIGRAGAGFDKIDLEACTRNDVAVFNAPDTLTHSTCSSTTHVWCDRIIFQIGDDRIAIKWTAEIDELPPARPIAVEPKRQPKLGRSPWLRS